MSDEKQEYIESEFDYVLRFSSRFTDGQIIVNEGEGNGATSYPWALNDYEAALGLHPIETWLLIKMIGHVWKQDSRSYFSMSGVEKTAQISRTKLDKVIAELKRKGYIHCEGQKGKFDKRNIYDVTGVYLALTFAIQCNPDSGFAMNNGGACTMADLFTTPPKEFANFATPAQVNEYYHERGKYFNWCTASVVDLDAEGKVYKYWHVCEACCEDFPTNAHNAKRCPDCRADYEEYRLQVFLESRAGNMAST